MAYKAHYRRAEESLPAEQLKKEVEVHADQAWLVDENDKGYATLHNQILGRFERAA